MVSVSSDLQLTMGPALEKYLVCCTQSYVSLRALLMILMVLFLIQVMEVVFGEGKGKKVKS